MGDWRMQGHAIRRRMGAPSNTLGAAHSGSPEPPLMGQEELKADLEKQRSARRRRGYDHERY